MRKHIKIFIIFVMALAVCLATSAFAFIPKVAYNLKSSQMQKEVFKDIPNYKGYYQISNLGRIKTVARDVNNYRKHRPSIILKQTTRKKDGYKQICLRKNGDSKYVMVHRLVATAFIPNPYNKKTVNHKNGIKSDNKIENLEWMTLSENIQHAFDTGLKKAPSGKDHFRYKNLTTP